MDPEQWTVDEVGTFLDDNNFKEYRKLFCEENRIDGRVLLSLTEMDLKQPPFNIAAFGDLKRIIFLIDNLREKRMLFDSRKGDIFDKHTFTTLNPYIHIDHSPSSNSGSSSPSCPISMDSDDDSISIRKLKVEPKKFALSVFYLFVSHFSSGFAVSYAQEHLPDKKQYPPLPDLFLDRLPYKPWAFRVTEGVIIVLTLIGLTMLFFHKYRFIVMQRLMIIAGTVYFLRSLCVVSTSIPMPQKNYDCSRLELKDGWDRFAHVLRFYAAIGMKSAGIKTCGDYVYSGHTVIITLLVLSINEYTPRRMTWLHALNWIIGFFGAFFILMGHGHYTLDILLAFVISFKLFAVHHVLANNISLMTRDDSRLKTLFPVFYYFEKDTDGYIPHEYEWPLPRFNRLDSFYQDLKYSFNSYIQLKTKS